MDSLNNVTLVGTLERDPTMRFVPASGSPCCTATLRCDEAGSGEQVFRLYVPLESHGRCAEALCCPHGWRPGGSAGQARLAQQARGEEKGGLVVMVSRVSVLLEATATARTRQTDRQTRT